MSRDELLERVAYRSTVVAGTEIMTACSRHSYPRHTHDTYAIGLIDAGGQSWWSGRGQVEAGAGSVISQNPGEVHDGRPIGDRARSWRMLYVEPAQVATIVDDLFEGDAPEFEFSEPAFPDSPVAFAFDRTFRVLAVTRGQLRAETAMMNLFALAARHGAARPPKTFGLPEITRAVRLIDAHPAAPLTLSDLARACSLTRFQLIRGFTRALGLPPHAYIVQRRLELSRRLLKTGNPISETALTAGFYDQAHFTRHFTRQFGLSPGAYARSFRPLHFCTRSPARSGVS